MQILVKEKKRIQELLLPTYFPAAVIEGFVSLNVIHGSDYNSIFAMVQVVFNANEVILVQSSEISSTKPFICVR